MPELFQFIHWLIGLYMWFVIAAVIMSWLVSFNIINRSNQFVNMIGSALYAITEPPLRRIRRYVPAMGGLDLSPLILIIGLIFLRDVVLVWLFRSVTG